MFFLKVTPETAIYNNNNIVMSWLKLLPYRDLKPPTVKKIKLFLLSFFDAQTVKVLFRKMHKMTDFANCVFVSDKLTQTFDSIVIL